MAIAYYGSRISPHMTKTPEGYLICHDVPINRTGDQEYQARDLQLDGDPDRLVTVHRYPEDVFEAAALASFEGKDITSGHPPDNLTPETQAAYSKGHIQNVRRVGDHTVADLHIKDPVLISDVENGVIREVSCGYLCNYEPDGEGYRQTHIRGVTTAATALDAAPAEKAPEAEPAEDKGKMEPAADEMVERAPKGDDIGSKLDRILAMLEAKSRGGRGEHPLHDETDLDEMIEKLGGEKKDEEAAVVVPAEEMEDGCMKPAANDAAIELLRRVRPAVAQIQDKAERARVVDALLSTVKGPDMVSSIMQAAQDSARQRQQASSQTNYEKICAEAQSAYDARNPHKQKEA